MISRLFPSAVATALVGATLSGCMTPHVQPAPSQAILQARAQHTVKPAACAQGGLEAISPLEASFPFDDATLSELGQQRLAAAVRWLGCNPGVEVVIRPDADNHGEPAHLNDLAQRRAKAVADQLRTLGASEAVLRLLPRGGGDPVTAPHLLINATGRGW